MENSGSLEQTLQDGNILRQLNALIVAHLRHNNLSQACLCSHLHLSSLGFMGIAIFGVKV